ncbi:YxeA family protein [Vagococcus fluvialis]|uniref:YxeA family protein n=1 Tax=Vagococcus fluvialis TaxID=2738 RepID=UPI0022DEE792|nr:YxeA family protein [Vagococcus fluvialis]
MKKKVMVYMSLFLGLAFLFYGTPLITKNKTSDTAMILDLLNPFVKNTEVYLKTSDDYVDTYKSKGEEATNYVYITTTYTEKGKKRQLKYVSFGKKLTPNKYLKVTIKGQDVRRWEEIPKKEVPEKAIEKLK